MKTKVTNLRTAYPELSPDKDYPPLKFKSLKGKVSAAEWEARVDCACAYRLVRHYGMDDMVYNHISAKIPGTEEFLLNLSPYEQAMLLASLPLVERRLWMRSYEPDDAADLLQEAPAELRDELLSLLDEVARREVRALLPPGRRQRVIVCTSQLVAASQTPSERCRAANAARRLLIAWPAMNLSSVRPESIETSATGT